MNGGAKNRTSMRTAIQPADSVDVKTLEVFDGLWKLRYPHWYDVILMIKHSSLQPSLGVPFIQTKELCQRFHNSSTSV